MAGRCYQIPGNRRYPRFFPRKDRSRYAVAVNTVNSSELRRRYSARRDTVAVILVTCAAAIICVKFDVSEVLASWTRLHENLQLDELPGVLLVLAVCLIWFSARRYLEADRELTLRRAAESKLAEAFAENQRLALKYVDTQESERKTLAHDLHDELGQYVNAIKLDAVAMRERVSALGGTTALASARGEGFKIAAFLPVAQPHGAGAEFQQ